MFKKIALCLALVGMLSACSTHDAPPPPSPHGSCGPQAQKNPPPPPGLDTPPVVCRSPAPPPPNYDLPPAQ